MISTNNLESGKIEFTESQFLVAAWYEENEISSNINMVQGNDNLLFLPGNKFNNFDVVEYQHFDFEEVSITGITKDDPGVVTANNHGFENDQLVKIIML